MEPSGRYRSLSALDALSIDREVDRVDRRFDAIERRIDLSFELFEARFQAKLEQELRRQAQCVAIGTMVLLLAIAGLYVR